MEMAKQGKGDRRGEPEVPLPATSPQRQIMVGESSSPVVWFRGWNNFRKKVEHFRVDIHVDNVEEQMKIRHSRFQPQHKRKQKKHNQQQRCCEIIDLPHPRWNKALRIFYPDSNLVVRDCCFDIVAVGPYLCSAGGRAGGHRAVISTSIYCLDTTNLDLGWKRYHMTTGRIFPYMAPMHDKLYIFGSHHRKGIGSANYAEVFDPSTGISKLLTRYPKGYDTDCHLIIPFPDKNMIMLCAYMSTRAVCYDVTSDRWFIENGHRFPSLHSTRYYSTIISSALTSDTIYWFTPFAYFAAYDFHNKEVYFPNPEDRLLLSKELDTLDPQYLLPALLHLSDDLFCLAWIGANYQQIHDTMYNIIHFTKLKISKCVLNDKDLKGIPEERKFLSVSVLHRQSYLVKSQWHFMGAAAVNLKKE